MLPMQSQSTAPRTVTAKSGMILPCMVDQLTDLNLVLTAVTVYYKHAGCKGSFDAVIRVAEAMRDSGPVVVLYIGLDGGQDARVLWPNSISLTKENNIVAKCYCTMRQQWRTFRLDRILTCHPLTTPDDAEEAA